MRSLLFVPAHDKRKLEKALDSGADALILDLEDSVPEEEKSRARDICAEFVKLNQKSTRIFVRVNALCTGSTRADLEAVVSARPYGIMLPKCEGVRDVATLNVSISQLEEQHGLQAGLLFILPIVTETAAALFEMGSYTQAGKRLFGMMWGGEDLAADVGTMANRGNDGRYTAPYELARSLTLFGATAAHVPAIDAVYTNFRDTDGLKTEAAKAVRDGFSAKAAIHPEQIGPIHAAFTPSASEVEWARSVIAAFDEKPGSGAVSIDGKMLDRPHYRAALRMLVRTGTIY